MTTVAQPTTTTVPIGQVIPDPRNARTVYDPAALKELAASIKARGLIQPLVLRPTGNPTGQAQYIVVAGHRRLKAAKLAGLQNVEAVIRTMTPAEAHLAQFAENYGREDLTALEQAVYFKRHLESTKITQEQLAKALGVSPSVVADALTLLELPEGLQRKWFEGERALSASHGREFARLVAHPKDLAMVVKWFEEVSRPSWKGRVTEVAAKELRQHVSDRLAMIKRRLARAAAAKAGKGKKRTKKATPQESFREQQRKWDEERKEREAIQAAALKVLKRDIPKYVKQLEASPAYRVIRGWPGAMVARLAEESGLTWELGRFQKALLEAVPKGARNAVQLAAWFLWGIPKVGDQLVTQIERDAKALLASERAAEKAKAAKHPTPPARKGARK